MLSLGSHGASWLKKISAATWVAKLVAQGLRSLLRYAYGLRSDVIWVAITPLAYRALLAQLVKLQGME